MRSKEDHKEELEWYGYVKMGKETDSYVQSCLCYMQMVTCQYVTMHVQILCRHDNQLNIEHKGKHVFIVIYTNKCSHKV